MTDVTAVEDNDSELRRSISLYRRARHVFPSGVTRTTISRDPHPVYVDYGEGAHIVDVDGNRYLDFANNFTTLIHGHSFEPVCRAVVEQITRGTCFANPTSAEVDLAELLKKRVPSIDRIRFVNSGTEAVMFAIKASRALTNRPAVAKLEGAYHGAYDWAEVSEGSAPGEWGDDKPRSVPYYRGMPQSVLAETVVLPTNNVDATRDILLASRHQLACILIDVMPSRAGLSPVDVGYLAFLREFSEDHQIVLISDEVLNFRQSISGAAERFGFRPDLIALGKIIGGGLPIGAIAGSEECMSMFADDEARPKLPQGGTFSANPLSMVAGYASMVALNKKEFAALETMGDQLRHELQSTIRRYDAPLSISGQASLFRIHPMAVAPKTYREAYRTPAQAEYMRRFSRALRNRGIFMPSNGPGALSTAMTSNDIDAFTGVFAEFVQSTHGNGR